MAIGGIKYGRVGKTTGRRGHALDLSLFGWEAMGCSGEKAALFDGRQRKEAATVQTLGANTQRLMQQRNRISLHRC